MPYVSSGEARIYYEEHGRGFPLLAIAPGGMDSTADFWPHAAINPLAAFPDPFRIVVMDQRNTGRSSGPLDAADPWGSYARDQLAVLDHLGVDRFLVLGCCIGGSFVLKLIEQTGDRVVGAVLQQPIGILPRNRMMFEEMWRIWGARLAAERPDVDPAGVEAFGTAMWSGDSVVSVPDDFVATVTTPLLVLPGVDDHHPTETGRWIGTVAPGGEVLEPWKDPEHLPAATAAVGHWLEAHIPAS
jgi:pimeloyl-ACP methyl ester carboxylesterase